MRKGNLFFRLNTLHLKAKRSFKPRSFYVSVFLPDEY